MAGRRPLTAIEERQLLKVARRLPPRDRALVTAQWLTGFRISEILSLKIGSVLRNGVLVEKIGIAPRNMKGGYGKTRWVPILPELQRTLESYLGWLGRIGILTIAYARPTGRASDRRAEYSAAENIRKQLIMKAYKHINTILCVK